MDILAAIKAGTGTSADYIGTANYMETLFADFIATIDLTVTGKATLTECVISDITPGSNIAKKSDSEVHRTGYNYEKVKELEIGASGTIKVSFQGGNGGANCKARIYINGTAVGTEKSLTTSYAEYTENSLSVNAGDLVQLYLKTYQSHSYVKEFRILISQQPGILCSLGINWSL